MFFVDISKSHNINSMWAAFLEHRALFLWLRNGIVCENFFSWLKIIFSCFSLFERSINFFRFNKDRVQLVAMYMVLSAYLHFTKYGGGKEHMETLTGTVKVP